MFIHEAVLYLMTSGSYVSGTGRRQLLLLPDMIEDYVGENNPARFIDTFVDSIDLHDLGFRYSFLENGAGRPSYNPHDLLKIYLWGYYNAIRSSRKLEAECNRNIEVMWLTRKLSPKSCLEEAIAVSCPHLKHMIHSSHSILRLHE